MGKLIINKTMLEIIMIYIGGGRTYIVYKCVIGYMTIYKSWGCLRTYFAIAIAASSNLDSNGSNCR